MKLQLLLACAFAVANAEYFTPVYQVNSIDATHRGQYSNYASPVCQSQVKSEYVPVIKDGVPIDTPEVQQAKAVHFALYAKAAAAAQAAKLADAHKLQARQYLGGNYRSTQAYYPPTTDHYSLAPDSSSSSSYIYQSGGHLSNSGTYTSQNEPVDTAEVQQARKAHLVAVERAAARAAVSAEHHRYRRGIVNHDIGQNLYYQHVPVITKDGVPLETSEVQAAKAQHLLAHANAKAGHQEWQQGGGDYGTNSGIWANYGTPEVNKVHYSISHTYGGWQPYTGPQHYPIIGKDGVPVETPEVQIAKQQHFVAHSQAKLGLNAQTQTVSYGSSYPYNNITPDGVPEETLEVKIAKAKHFAAHAEERAKHVKWAGQPSYGERYSYGIGPHY